MGRSNGNKAQMKRERNQKAAQNRGADNSQLKVNAAAKSLQCSVCRQTFLGTAAKPVLDSHVESKHNKKATFEQCFPGFGKE